MRLVLLALGSACWLCSLGCTTSYVGATDAELARGHDVASEGAALFAKECASCHGRRGQGVSDAPAVLGPGALPEYPRDNPASGVPGIQDPQQAEVEQRTRRTGSKLRPPFRTAADLYAFVGGHGRGPRLRSPEARAAHDWTLVTFLMAVQGAQLPAEGLSADNASAVPLPQR
jgi:hypothetical protein